MTRDADFYTLVKRVETLEADLREAGALGRALGEKVERLEKENEELRAPSKHTALVQNVLADNIGFIELLDHLGGDLAAVNGARASFGREKTQFDEKDARLLERLGRDQHQTPLRHVYIQVHVKAPEFVARQWYKHIVGCEYNFKDLPWSEFSQRYKEVTPEFYVPNVWRAQSTTNKQGSHGLIGKSYTEEFKEIFRALHEAYKDCLSIGMAREQARLLLPMATYTEWTWTASIQAVVHFCTLRDHEGAQWEIQQYARVLKTLVEPLAPSTWAALEKNHPLRAGK